MIVRIMGDGQYELDTAEGDEFETLDEALLKHIEAGDSDAYRRDLASLVELVRRVGTELSYDEFRPSDQFLPDPTVPLEEVRALLEAEEGEQSA